MSPELPIIPTDIIEMDDNHTEHPHKSIDTAELWASFPADQLWHNGGSPFIHSVCATLDKFGPTYTLDDLAKKVNEKLRSQKSAKTTLGGIKYQLTARFENALTKDLHFQENHNIPSCSRNDIYPLTNKRDCLIIPVGLYSKATLIRPNAGMDADVLRSSFSRLGFNCIQMATNVTSDQALRKIAELAGNQDGKDMVAICILAHGTSEKMLMFSDGKTVQLDYLLDKIVTCPSLLDKPKIIVLQACRGSAQSFLGTTIYKPSTETDDPACKGKIPIEKTFSNLTGKKKLKGDDIVELWASPPENKAFRNGQVSFFIESLCLKLDELGESRDIEYIFKLVCCHMRDRPAVELQTKDGNTEYYKLASYIEHRLRRKVVFNAAVPVHLEELPDFSSDPVDVDNKVMLDSIKDYWYNGMVNHPRRCMVVKICLFLLFVLFLTAVALGVKHNEIKNDLQKAFCTRLDNYSKKSTKIKHSNKTSDTDIPNLKVGEPDSMPCYRMYEDELMLNDVEDRVEQYHVLELFVPIATKPDRKPIRRVVGSLFLMKYGTPK